MTKQVTKEQVVFLVGAAVFVWVMVKLALFVAHQDRPAGSPMAPAAGVQPGDSAMEDFLATRGLDTYMRGDSDFSAGDTSQPTQLFIRTLVSHALLPTSRISRFTYECRMSPNPTRELRFRLPDSAKVADVFSKELDPDRKWGVDGSTLVVPLNPTLIKRAYYRCDLKVVLQGPLSAPAVWTAPIVACAESTSYVVACELGCIAVATPGDHFHIVSKDAPQSNLTRVALEAVPKELAATSNKLAYTFRQPNYTLTLDIKPRVTAVVSTHTKGEPVFKSKSEPIFKAKGEPILKGTDTQLKEQTPKLDIPRAGDAEGLPFKLAAIVRIEEPESRRQAVLRNKDSGEYMRKFEGDTVMDDLRVVSITDDAVVIADSTGKRYKFADRFEDKYNAATPANPPSAKKGGAPPGKTKG